MMQTQLCLVYNIDQTHNKSNVEILEKCGAYIIYDKMMFITGRPCSKSIPNTVFPVKSQPPYCSSWSMNTLSVVVFRMTSALLSWLSVLVPSEWCWDASLTLFPVPSDVVEAAWFPQCRWIPDAISQSAKHLSRFLSIHFEDQLALFRLILLSWPQIRSSFSFVFGHISSHFNRNESQFNIAGFIYWA